MFKKIHFSRNIEESKKNEVFNQKVIKELKKHEDEEKVKEEELNKNDDDDDDFKKQMKLDQEEKSKNTFKTNFKKKKKKIETPIYITLYDIFKFRVVKFFMLCFSLFYTFLIFNFLEQRSLANISQKYQTKECVESAVLYNPVLKNLCQRSYLSENINNIVQTQSDFLIYLDISINNLMFTANLNKNNLYQQLKSGIDNDMGYFQKPFSIYEILDSIKISRKSVIPDAARTKSIALPFNISSKLKFYSEFSPIKSDSKPIKIINVKI